MHSPLLFVSSFLGGLFIGFLAALFGGIVFGLIKEGIGKPKEFGLAAVILLAIFAPAFLYFIYIMFNNETIILGAAVSIIYLARGIFSSEESEDGQSLK